MEPVHIHDVAIPFWQFVIPGIMAIIWLVRLEAKVIGILKDINGLGKKSREMDFVLRNDLKRIEISLARIETKCGVVHEDHKSRDPDGERD